MDPINGEKVEPHVYTQEEARELKEELEGSYMMVHDLEEKFTSMQKKLNAALYCMEKEQLIEFINNTLF